MRLRVLLYGAILASVIMALPVSATITTYPVYTYSNWGQVAPMLFWWNASDGRIPLTETWNTVELVTADTEINTEAACNGNTSEWNFTFTGRTLPAFIYTQACQYIGAYTHLSGSYYTFNAKVTTQFSSINTSEFASQTAGWVSGNTAMVADSLWWPHSNLYAATSVTPPNQTDKNAHGYSLELWDGAFPTGYAPVSTSAHITTYYSATSSEAIVHLFTMDGGTDNLLKNTTVQVFNHTTGMGTFNVSLPLGANDTHLIPDEYQFVGYKSGYDPASETATISDTGEWWVYLRLFPAGLSQCYLTANVRDIVTRTLLGGSTAYLWDKTTGANYTQDLPYGYAPIWLNQSDNNDAWYMNASYPGYIGQWIGLLTKPCGSTVDYSLTPVNQSSAAGNCTQYFKVRDYQSFTQGTDLWIPGALVALTSGQSALTDSVGTATFTTNATATLGFNVSMSGYNNYGFHSSCGGYASNIIPVYLVQGTQPTATMTQGPSTIGTCPDGDSACGIRGALSYFIKYAPFLGAILFIALLVGFAGQMGKSLKGILR